MKITTKRYVVSTSALNCYGYRVLTSGIELSQFLKNPVLTWMHKRPTGIPGEGMPVGRAVDVEVNDDQISCRLGFTESYPFAMQLYDMYEDGTLNMLSLGAKPLEMSLEASDMIEGQTGPTVTKSKAVEFACVDVGANDGALPCQLFDDADNVINLAALDDDAVIQLANSLSTQKIDKKNYKMKFLTLSAPIAAGIALSLNLGDNATETDLQKAIGDMVKLASDREASVVALTADKENLTTQLKELKDAADEAAVIKLVDDNANRFLPAQRENFIKLAKADFDGTQAVLLGMPVLQSVSSRLNNDNSAQSAEHKGLIQLSYDELDKAGKLPRLKEIDPDGFNLKFQERFGTDYTGK